MWRKLGLHGPPPLLFYFENGFVHFADFSLPSSPAPQEKLAYGSWQGGPPALAVRRTLTFLWLALFCSVTRLVSLTVTPTTHRGVRRAPTSTMTDNM